jgi:hypothetical protein
VNNRQIGNTGPPHQILNCGCREIDLPRSDKGTAVKTLAGVGQFTLSTTAVMTERQYYRR